MADVFLLPGSVGLAILDSFAAGLPLLTTELRTHGPEISYLDHGHNGLIIAHDIRAYATAVTDLFKDPNLMARLRTGATQSGCLHSIENMVQNFRLGILSCLALQKASELPDEGKAALLSDAAQDPSKQN
jgi:glycosyltransferase involved in cell wall biosynthesis